MTKPVAVLIGLPACGKSTVGKLIAQRLGVDYVDTDSMIESQTGMSCNEIFQQYGENHFRSLEETAVRKCLDTHNGVVSLGGGAITSPNTQEILKNHTVVYIKVDFELALERIMRHPTRRPLIANTPRESLEKLLLERGPLYEKLAKIIVHSSANSASNVAEQVLRQLWRATNLSDGVSPKPFINVKVTGEKPYSIYIGDIKVSDLILQSITQATKKIFLVYPPSVASPAQALAKQLAKAEKDVVQFVSKVGETGKSIAEIERMWQMIGEEKFNRDDLIIAFGGGATTDAAGFAAATWLRGIKYINIPTTLLAMVDASIGGKTAINTPNGKNIVGAFYPPAAVICHLPYLASLSAQDLHCGLAEIIKCGFIYDPEIINIIQSTEDAFEPTSEVILELIARAVNVKAQVVSEDITDLGIREILNYGHTFGHAIEKCENYQVTHGQAVAIGCVYAAEIARIAGLLSDEEVALHRKIFSEADLPITYKGEASWTKLREAMSVDKKVRAQHLRFVVLEGVGKPSRIENPSEEMLVQAFKAIS